jgi:hypothetical protein
MVIHKQYTIHLEMQPLHLQIIQKAHRPNLTFTFFKQVLGFAPGTLGTQGNHATNSAMPLLD